MEQRSQLPHVPPQGHPGRHRLAPTRCTPRDAENGPLNSGAGPLATTRIIEADKATTTTVVGPANAKNGTPVTLSANVSGGANGGTVQFFDGDNPLEDAVPVTGGSASISPTFTEDGPHSITASYSGAPGFLASTSASAKIVTVTTDAPPDAVTTTATVSPSTAKVGQDVNLTAKSIRRYRRHRRFHRRRHRNGQCSGRNRRSCRRSVHLHLDRNAQGCREVHGLTRIRAVRCPGIPGQCDDAGSG